ncbi:hypothetical protein HMPREF0083_05803 [Aneurinibacillus aneurinilyticus ATCC 12856]|jgi:putative transposase|uniref:Transposase putative helix-turn-helix domain-containing protein n=1 Tax=Aneurinibacillus aneurinilyticus ATCC 12856 TaxID=649747 RepID=U1W9A2_ANEAE|nr:hypothetical protein HMPREF0083_05803 [Aneurinibacillus aneurinilyticus ATCC 12856]
MANKAYKFRLYPTGEQKQLLAKTFGCVRFVYNKMLAERKETLISGHAEFPKFKNRKTGQSYTTSVVNGNIMPLDGYIKLPTLKLVKIKQHREIPFHHLIKVLYVIPNQNRKIRCFNSQ